MAEVAREGKGGGREFGHPGVVVNGNGTITVGGTCLVFAARVSEERHWLAQRHEKKKA